MFAKARTARVKGRTKMFEKNSIGTRMNMTQPGMPDGQQRFFMPPTKPCFLKVRPMYVTQTTSASPAGYAIRDITGNWANGTMDMMFMIHTKKNIETSIGTYFSPFLPMVSSTMLRLTKSYPISPTSWNLPGSSFGLANAAQKKPTTSRAQMIDSSIGLVKSTLPTEKIGLNSNSPRPGAGKPQPESKWQPASEASWTSAPTTDSFVLTHGYGNLGVSAWPEATVRHWNSLDFSLT